MFANIQIIGQAKTKNSSLKRLSLKSIANGVKKIPNTRKLKNKIPNWGFYIIC
jgi:hypothetical protein